MKKTMLALLAGCCVAASIAAADVAAKAEAAPKSAVAAYQKVEEMAKKVELTVYAKFGGPVTQTVRASCQTERSDWDGRQDKCAAQWQVLEAPAGSVIVDNQLGVSKSGNGTYECSYYTANAVEIVPGSGIKMPTKFYYSAWAWSHEGPFGGAGHVDCTYTVLFAVYQK